MGKLYHTHEVKEIFDKFLDDMILKGAADENMKGAVLGSYIEQTRLLRNFANEIISEMEKQDLEYEEEIAEWRRKAEEREAQKIGTDS